MHTTSARAAGRKKDTVLTQHSLRVPGTRSHKMEEAWAGLTLRPTLRLRPPAPATGSLLTSVNLGRSLVPIQLIVYLPELSPSFHSFVPSWGPLEGVGWSVTRSGSRELGQSFHAEGTASAKLGLLLEPCSKPAGHPFTCPVLSQAGPRTQGRKGQTHRSWTPPSPKGNAASTTTTSPAPGAT